MREYHSGYISHISIGVLVKSRKPPYLTTVGLFQVYYAKGISQDPTIFLFLTIGKQIRLIDVYVITQGHVDLSLTFLHPGMEVRHLNGSPC